MKEPKPYKYYDESELISVVREGVTMTYFTNVSEATPFTPEDWSAYLHLSERTIQRYKKEKRNFDPIHSEKILEIAMLYARGRDVFGDENRFDTWLETESVALGNSKPKDLLTSSFGIRMVDDELGRIEYGVLA
ncbi:MAG: DUF2384 domain-containing protein [Mucilaginibacter polytrichastri]|nr:DUF2384 domain-containing protein [Mucilaginibacter polytrichastri]